MIINDLHINSIETAKDRMRWLGKKLKAIADGEEVLFLGETFIEKDLNLSVYVEFIELLNHYPNLSVFVDATGLPWDLVFSEKGLLAKESIRQLSWYKLPLWPDHVHLITDETELAIKRHKDHADKVEEFSHDRYSQLSEPRLAKALPVTSYSLKFYEEKLKDSVIKQCEKKRYILLYFTYERDMIGLKAELEQIDERRKALYKALNKEKLYEAKAVKHEIVKLEHVLNNDKYILSIEKERVMAYESLQNKIYQMEDELEKGLIKFGKWKKQLEDKVVTVSEETAKVLTDIYFSSSFLRKYRLEMGSEKDTFEAELEIYHSHRIEKEEKGSLEINNDMIQLEMEEDWKRYENLCSWRSKKVDVEETGKNTKKANSKPSTLESQLINYRIIMYTMEIIGAIAILVGLRYSNYLSVLALLALGLGIGASILGRKVYSMNKNVKKDHIKRLDRVSQAQDRQGIIDDLIGDLQEKYGCVSENELKTHLQDEYDFRERVEISDKDDLNSFFKRCHLSWADERLTERGFLKLIEVIKESRSLIRLQKRVKFYEETCSKTQMQMEALEAQLNTDPLYEDIRINQIITVDKLMALLAKYQEKEKEYLALKEDYSQLTGEDLLNKLKEKEKEINQKLGQLSVMRKEVVEKEEELTNSTVSVSRVEKKLHELKVAHEELPIFP